MTSSAPTDLPAAVRAWFERTAAGERADTLELFAADATVTDDGRTYRGTDEVRGWLTGAVSEWTYTTTVQGTERTDDGGVVVHTLIEGNFPGGRAELRNRFGLDADGAILTLTIAP